MPTPLPARAPRRARQSPLVLFAIVCFALCVASTHASRFHLRVEASPTQQQPPSSSTPPQLPVIFFHGLNGNASSGNNLRAHLTAGGRVFHALSFCENACAAGSLDNQTSRAIAQVRAVVNGSAAFAKGYIFVGHSQGATLARAVIENMDDHKVRALVSLAGAQNGVFYGPQPNDATPALAFVKRLGPGSIAPALFNFSKYAPADLASGQFQLDFNAFALEQHPELQAHVAVLGLARSPVAAAWRDHEPFLARLNNVAPCKGHSPDDVSKYDDGYSNSLSRKRQACEAAQVQRKLNFAKLVHAHFFASPDDGIVAPWQSSVLGQYEDVASAAELRARFRDLRVLNVTQTPEFRNDTYGLRALDERKGLFLHTVPNVEHSCWVGDSTPLGASTPCRFRPVFDQHVFPVFAKIDAAAHAAPLPNSRSPALSSTPVSPQ